MRGKNHFVVLPAEEVRKMAKANRGLAIAFGVSLCVIYALAKLKITVIKKEG